MKIKHFVRQSLFLALLGPSGSGVFAQNLPPIDAHRFQSAPIQASSSGRVYRFSMRSADVPRVGNIVLIQENGKPTMAFRVMQSDPGRKQYVGKRVRRYDNHETLVLNRDYGSVEKIADKINAPNSEPEPETVMGAADALPPAPPASPAPAPRVKAPVARVARPVPTPEPTPFPEPTPEPQSIMEALPPSTPDPTPEPMPIEESPVTEIQATPAPPPDLSAPEFDQRLDEGSSPTAQNRRTKTFEASGEIDDPGSAYEISESKRYDTNHNMISAQPGIYRNASDFVAGGELFTGITVSYSHKLRDDWLIRSVSTQDSLWFEFGLSNYRKVGLSGEVYTLFPARTEIRWEINLNENFAFQFYGGIQYNFVMSKDNFNPFNNSQVGTLDQLEGLQPTFGAGLMVHVGPQWYIRSELGYDRVNLGLGVKW